MAIRKYDGKQHGVRNGESETGRLVKKGYQVTGAAESPLGHGSFNVQGVTSINHDTEFA